MNKNPKLLMVVAAVMLTGILSLFIFSDDGAKAPEKANKKSSVYDTASADTNNETLKTLVASQQRLERENKALMEKNKALTKKGLAEYKEKFEQEKTALNQQFLNEKGKLLTELKLSMKANEAMNHANTYPIGGVNSAESNASSMIGDVTDLSQSMNTIPASDSSVNPKNSEEKPNLPSHFSGDLNSDDVNAFYTIPANSTLSRTTLMTNIVAEVPVAGHLIEPAMPFKAIIGRQDLLASNGMTLPEDLGGIVVSGYSVGNMALSCARMYVTQLLFTFQDGTFTVYPSENKLNGSEIYPKDALGYLSDQYGNVCLTGKYITDAPKVIASLTAFGGAVGFGEYTSQAQTTTYNNATGPYTEITGNAAKYGLGNAMGTGSDMALKWYTQRIVDIFDAVYIPKMAGKHLRHFVFNATQTIPIDTSATSRKLYFNHEESVSPKNNELD